MENEEDRDDKNHKDKILEYNVNSPEDASYTQEDNASYHPSVGEIMDQFNDFDQISSTASSQDDTSELDNLIKESTMPITDLISQYDSELKTSKRKASPSEMDSDRKRRALKKISYDKNPEIEDVLFFITRKQVSVGPQFQADVPDKILSEPYDITEQLDYLIYDPCQEDSMPINDFFAEIKKSRPSIPMLDDNIFHFFTKHGGKVESALNDVDTLDKIEKIQSSPLTDFTLEECYEFKNALLKCGKDFRLMREHFFPNKTVKDIVHTYYIWKKSPIYDEFLSILKQQSPLYPGGVSYSDSDTSLENENSSSESRNGDLDSTIPVTGATLESEPSLNNSNVLNP